MSEGKRKKESECESGRERDGAWTKVYSFLMDDHFDDIAIKDTQGHCRYENGPRSTVLIHIIQLPMKLPKKIVCIRCTA